MKKISVVIPVYNEEANIPRAYREIKTVLDSLSNCYEYEILFTDNHSEDNSFHLLQDMAARDPLIKVVRFSKNFGYQRSIYTGYMLSRGDAVVQLDCDLQDPPALIHEFIAKWEEGYSVVYGIRRTRAESWFISVARLVFYRLIDWLSEDTLPLDAGDFRLVDKKVIQELRKIYDFNPYLRGTISVMGFNQIGVPYDRLERKFGESKFPFLKLVRLAMDGLVNHSLVPLKLAHYIGVLTFFSAFCLMVGYIIAKLVFSHAWPTGFTTITTLILLSIGLNALFLGIIGEYLGRIYQQVRKHPITIIEKTLNLDSSHKEGSVAE